MGGCFGHGQKRRDTWGRGVLSTAALGLGGAQGEITRPRHVPTSLWVSWRVRLGGWTRFRGEPREGFVRRVSFNEAVLMDDLPCSRDYGRSWGFNHE